MTVVVLKPKKVQASRRTSARSGPVIRLGEMATPERMRQEGGIVKDIQPEGPQSRVMIMRHRARFARWIDRYLARGKIDKSEYAAGLRFAEAWWFTTVGFSQQRSMEVIDCGRGNAENIKEKARFSERTIREAFQILTTPQKLVVISCCGMDEAAGDKDRLQTLRRGLDVLSRHWRL